MKNKKLLNILAGIIFAFCLVTLPASVYADDWGTYGAYTEDRVLPVVGGEDTGPWTPSWFTAVDYFPDVDVRDDPAVMIENFEGEGRLIAATGNKIFLQRTYGSDQWDVVATVVNNAGVVDMDPCFIKVSPNGEKIALGVGYCKPLVIIDTSALSISTPLVINISTENTGYIFFDAEIKYYDAEWYNNANGPAAENNQYLLIDGSTNWPDPVGLPPYDLLVFTSGIGVVDTLIPTRPGYRGYSLINKSCASAGVGFDSYGNLYCGDGYGDTGQIRILAKDDYSFASPNPTPIDYTTLPILKNGEFVLGRLSSAWLGVDAEDNVTVGGGNFYGNWPGTYPAIGYAALIHYSVAAGILDGTGNPVDYNDPAEWQEFVPDSCKNDTSTGILFGSWGKGLAVMYNLVTGPTSCANGDEWQTGVTPYLKIYYPDFAPEGDGDGIPNSADNAYLSANAGQQDTDGDGYGNICDADFNTDDIVDLQDYNAFNTAWNSSGSGLDADFNSDNVVDSLDYDIFSTKWGTTAPWY